MSLSGCCRSFCPAACGTGASISHHGTGSSLAKQFEPSAVSVVRNAGGLDTMYITGHTSAYGTNWRVMWHCCAGGVTEWSMREREQ